jgi:Domain of unknown function (DUF1996)
MRRSITIGVAVLAVVATASASAGAVGHAMRPSGTPTSMAGHFAVVCTYSHTKAVDPIMAYGQIPSPHKHDFFGNTGVHARSTRLSLLHQPTTCQDRKDTSGYWEPEPLYKGHVIHAAKLLAYYYGGPDTISPPFGLKMMAGNAKARHPLPKSIIAWSCGNGSGTTSPRMTHPYNCNTTPGVVNPRGVTGIVIFPSCWNGKRLGPMDVMYPVNDVCPSGTKLIPQLQERFQFSIMDGTKLSFVTGAYYTFHADFFQTWRRLRLPALVKSCLKTPRNCGFVK